MAPRVGFEPTTLGLEVLCSIQLSYRGLGSGNYTLKEAHRRETDVSQI